LSCSDGPSAAVAAVRTILNDRLAAQVPAVEVPPATPTSVPSSGWLSKRLLDDAENPFPIELIQRCEEKLVHNEGFACEQDFVHLPEKEFTGEYLTQIGILGKGLHIRLRRLHRELQTEYSYSHSVVKRPRTN